MQKLVKITTIFTLSVGLIGASAQPVAAAKAKTVKAQITLTVDHKKVSTKKVTTTSKQTLMKVMKQHYQIKEDNGMITAINGHKQNTKTQKYWLYKINGKDATKGAAVTYLKNKDKVSFTLNASK